MQSSAHANTTINLMHYIHIANGKARFASFFQSKLRFYWFHQTTKSNLKIWVPSQLLCYDSCAEGCRSIKRYSTANIKPIKFGWAYSSVNY